MTREEAIEVLKDWDGYFIGHSSDDVCEALDMAINALIAIDTVQKIVDGDVDTIMRILKENEEWHMKK